MSNFYGTEIKIWAGFGPVGNTEKKNGPINKELLRLVFSSFKIQLHFMQLFSADATIFQK